MKGADLDYVQSLVGSNVNMDLGTFITMDPSVVLSLTVNQVKDLLGKNLPTLKRYENQPLVQNWIRMQYQSQLDQLNLGLVGGRADPTNTSPATVTNNPSASASASASTSMSGATTSGTTISGATTNSTTISTTKGSGTRIQADAGFSLFILMVFFVTCQHSLM
uniref:mesothelin-like protein n=1 Tax=Monopterus albus TaxID=43700 RepID=UPI0009B39A4B|nr:mesothelin-like protein [Monopterus albus]